MRRLIQLILLPVLLGLAIGLSVVLSITDYRHSLGDLLLADRPSPSPQTSSYAVAVSRAAPAVVNISTQRQVQQLRHPLFDDPLFRYFFNSADIPRQERMSSALGSGVIVNDAGFILTNHHVVVQAENIYATLTDGRLMRAQLVGSDPETDLAVLKIDADNLQTISLGEPRQARIGDVVLAIGNPFNIGQTVTQGIISATGRHGLGLTVYENFIQTDAAINPGNSGGALIDAQGNLLGINTAILNRNNSGTSIGIGFAIPADVAVSVMNDIITTGQAVRGWLGIEAKTVNATMVRSYNLATANGVLITGIYPHGPADKAGLQVGDVLTHINAQRIGNGRDGMNLIARVRPDVG